MAQYSITDIGKELQKYGFTVGQNPAFGKVGTHAPGSYHYSGKAIDVTNPGADVAPAYPGGTPLPWKQRIGELGWRAKQAGILTEVFKPGDPGHETHVHMALDKPVETTPQMLQWVATGRYTTPEGKLTDVMPTNINLSQQPVQKAGDTYIFVSRKPKEETDDFLSSFMQSALTGGGMSIKPSIDAAGLLTQAFSQTPNYLT